MRVKFGLAAVFLPALLRGSPEIAPGFTFVPETPFRGNEIKIREPRGSEEFLDIFSYRLPYAWEERGERSAMKFQGTAGSVSTDRFWIDQRIHFAYDLARRLRFWARAFEAEDFDSRYRRFELGVDVQALSWLWLGVYGEVLAEKGGNDLGLRAVFPRVLGQRVTAGLELPDLLMNRRGEDLNQRYSRYGRSYYVDVEGGIGSRIAWHWGVRGNAPLALEDENRRLDFRYGQVSAYGRLRADVTDRLTCVFYAAGEGADKGYRPWSASDFEREDFFRRALQGRAELRWTVAPSITPYGGARAFRLQEKERFLDGSRPADLYRHREYLGYVGIELALTRYAVLRPELIAGHIDRVTRFAGPEGEHRSSHRWAGKLSFPLDIRFADNAGIIAGASLDLDEQKFGGGTLSLQMTY